MNHPDTFDRLRHSASVTVLAWLVLAMVVIVPPMFRSDLGWTVLKNYKDPISAGYPALVIILALLGAGPFRVLGAPVFRWLRAISFSV